MKSFKDRQAGRFGALMLAEGNDVTCKLTVERTSGFNHEKILLARENNEIERMRGNDDSIVEASCPSQSQFRHVRLDLLEFTNRLCWIECHQVPLINEG